MSYCVNCGVELAASEKVCPLCAVPVINPKLPWQEDAASPYPQDRVEVKAQRIDKNYVGFLITLPLLVVALASFAINLIFDHAISWSLYVAAALLIVYVAVVVPLKLKRARPFLCVVLNGLAILLLLFIIDITNPSRDWFFALAVPIVAALMLLTALFLRWFKHRRPIMLSTSLIILSLGIYTMIIQIVINAFLHISLMPTWSWYVLVPAAFTALGFYVLHKHGAWRESVRRRMFF